MYLINDDFVIKFISPTCIGGDKNDDLLPMFDYIKHDGNIYEINKAIFYEELSKNKSISDLQKLCTTLVKNIFESEASYEKWYDTIINENMINKESLLKEIALGENKISGSMLIIKNICGTNKAPFVPGSTLKGAIISALIYEYFKNDDNGKIQFSNKLNDIRNLIKDYDINDINNEKNRKIRKNLFDKTISFNKEILSFESKLFSFKITSDVKKPNKKNNKSQAVEYYKYHYNANLIRIYDSDLIKPENIKLYEQGRFYFKKIENKETIPLACFAIEPTNDEIAFKLQILNEFVKNKNSKIFSEFENNPCDTLIKLLNDWSLSCINSDIAFCEKAKDLKAEWLDAYIEKLQKIKKTIEESSNEAIIRIGNGKGWLYTTLAPLIYENDPELYKKFCTIIFKTNEEITPLTRVLTHTSHDMMGWISIKKKIKI